MLKGFHINTKTGIAQVGSIPNHYQDIQKLLDVRVFTIVSRKIGKKYYDIYADDEGLFIENNPLTVVTYGQDGNVIEQIVGSVFITRHDGNGRSKSLTDDEVKEIRNNLKSYIDLKHTIIRPVVVAKL